MPAQCECCRGSGSRTLGHELADYRHREGVSVYHLAVVSGLTEDEIYAQEGDDNLYRPVPLDFADAYFSGVDDVNAAIRRGTV